MRRRTATRSSWSARRNAINATLYEKLNFNFIRDITPVAGIDLDHLHYGGQPIVSGEDSSGVNCLCQGQSKQGQHGFGR